MELPSDVLRLIFKEYTRIDGSLTTLLSVSKQWRNVAIDMPSLWCRMHLCVDDTPGSQRNGSVPFPSTLKDLRTILDRTGTSRHLKVALVLGCIAQTSVIAAPTSLNPLPIMPIPTGPTDEDSLTADRRARLFGGLRYLEKRPADRIRSLRVEINPPMNRRLIEVSLGDLFDPTNPLPMMPVLERLKISLASNHTVPDICAAVSFLLHALSREASLLRTLCLERVPLGLLKRILSPFPFYGPYPNDLAKRLRRISIKSTFENLDISTFALAEALEELSFSGTLAYNLDIAPVTTSVTPLPGTNANLDEIMTTMWHTFYPEFATLPNFIPPPGNLTSICIPNLKRLCVGVMSMPTLQRLQLPMLEELTIMHMDQYDQSPLPPHHSIVLPGLRKLIIGTYRQEVDAIIASNLEYFEIGIPETTSGIIDEQSDWCTHGCSISDDGIFPRNCEGGIRTSHVNTRPSLPDSSLLNCIFDGDEAMLRPRSLRISGPVHDHVLVAALHHLPNLLSLTLNYRVAIGDSFWRCMTPRIGIQSTESIDTAPILCPKLKHLTLDLCTMSSNHPESDNLRGRLSEMIAARNGHTDIPSFESVSVRWKAPESGVASAIGSPMGHDDGAQFVIENITT